MFSRPTYSQLSDQNKMELAYPIDRPTAPYSPSSNDGPFTQWLQKRQDFDQSQLGKLSYVDPKTIGQHPGDQQLVKIFNGISRMAETGDLNGLMAAAKNLDGLAQQYQLSPETVAALKRELYVTINDVKRRMPNPAATNGTQPS